MAYADATQLRQYLSQIGLSGDKEDLLVAVLTRATSIVDGALGFSFAGYDSVASVKEVLSDGTCYLGLPPVDASSITAIAYLGTPYADYTLRKVRGRSWAYRQWLWPKDVYVSVTAKWGYGSAPASIIEVCLELAVNIWRSKDRGMFSDVIGVDATNNSLGGGAVIAARMFTNTQKDIVERVRVQYADVAI